LEPIRTIHRHLLEQEKKHPEAEGDFTQLMGQIALAAKIIGNSVNKAGLLDVLGGTGNTNIQGDAVQKLDVLANTIMKDVLLRSGTVAAIVSEEEEEIVFPAAEDPRGPYIVHFDPLDGSTNIDANVSIGTIFGIYRKVSSTSEVTDEDILQPGRALIGAGYVVYGASTMLVFSSGDGVHGFTYDPAYGEFLLSHRDISIPNQCKIYSANESRTSHWPPGAKEFIDHIKSRSEPRYLDITTRWIGSLVADVHRNILYGGVFLYPETKNDPNGKLRLLYECAPLAYIVEQAGGAASTGKVRILDIVPDALHQRVPFCIGNRDEVALYESYIAEFAKKLQA